MAGEGSSVVHHGVSEHTDNNSRARVVKEVMNAEGCFEYPNWADNSAPKFLLNLGYQ
jgi:hypothetical protein